mmetsp:Transcript_801/g.1977  ORF Transcript_801/g.1977 Transcript_801/m.1977 type:complete len:258 (+) Transcript_801:628-1401(+)
MLTPLSVIVFRMTKRTKEMVAVNAWAHRLSVLCSHSSVNFHGLCSIRVYTLNCPECFHCFLLRAVLAFRALSCRVLSSPVLSFPGVLFFSKLTRFVSFAATPARFVCRTKTKITQRNASQYNTGNNRMRFFVFFPAARRSPAISRRPRLRTPSSWTGRNSRDETSRSPPSASTWRDTITSRRLRVPAARTVAGEDGAVAEDSTVVDEEDVAGEVTMVAAAIAGATVEDGEAGDGGTTIPTTRWYFRSIPSWCIQLPS